MKKNFILLFTALQLVAVSLGAQNKPFLFGQQRKIFINNRILAQVNGKALSVIDVMKKMDLLFYRQFPQYAESTEARFQFYKLHWKNALQELVDKELVMADAEQSKIPVTNGEVRQELEDLFGPNIIANLDTAGLTFDEAWQMVKDDMLLRRVMMGKVNALAIRTVTPQKVRAAYEDYAQKNDKPDEWTYHVISIRADNPEDGAETANFTYALLAEDNVPLELLSERLKGTEKATIKVSEEYQHSSKEVSQAYQEILSTLEPATYSQPIAQKSRSNNSMVFRLFYLKERVSGGAPPFHQVESKLKDQLVNQTVGEETEKYLAKLRKHYNIKEEHLAERVPEDFAPFTLR